MKIDKVNLDKFINTLDCRIICLHTSMDEYTDAEYRKNFLSEVSLLLHDTEDYIKSDFVLCDNCEKLITKTNDDEFYEKEGCFCSNECRYEYETGKPGEQY